MALNTQLTDAAQLLSTGINEGMGAARTNLGGSGTAFGWAGGLVPTVADYATTATASGMSFKATLVTESGTPATVVAAGAGKPAAAALSSSSIDLKKFAGLGSFTLEDRLEAVGLGSAIASVLGASTLKAFESYSTAVLDAGAGSTVTGGDWVAAVANAQAEVLSNGGKPSVLVLSAADYGDFVADVLATNAFAQSPDSPVGAVLGTPVHVSPGLGTGKAFVFDSSAVLCVQHEASPLVVVDAVSQADMNVARLVIDLVAATWIADANLVVEITAPTLKAAKK